jgi:hypothetical protein
VEEAGEKSAVTLMAVCRFHDDSDVYVYYNSAGGIDCCSCVLSNKETFNAPDEAGMIAHLRDHLAAGHKVPCEAFERLENWANL